MTNLTMGQRVMVIVMTSVIAANVGVMGFIAARVIHHGERLAALAAMPDALANHIRVTQTDHTKLTMHGEQLAEIRANHFTSADGLKLYECLRQQQAIFFEELSAIRTELAAMPREVPPQWWLDEVRREVQRLENKIDAVQGTVDHLRTDIGAMNNNGN